MCIEYINWESPWNFSQDKQSYHFWYYYSNILILGYIFSEDSIFLQAATISVLSISSSDLNKRNITIGNKNLMLFRLKSWKKWTVCIYTMHKSHIVGSHTWQYRWEGGSDSVQWGLAVRLNIIRLDAQNHVHVWPGTDGECINICEYQAHKHSGLSRVRSQIKSVIC